MTLSFRSVGDPVATSCVEEEGTLEEEGSARSPASSWMLALSAFVMNDTNPELENLVALNQAGYIHDDLVRIK